MHAECGCVFISKSRLEDAKQMPSEVAWGMVRHSAAQLRTVGRAVGGLNCIMSGRRRQHLESGGQYT